VGERRRGWGAGAESGGSVGSITTGGRLASAGLTPSQEPGSADALYALAAPDVSRSSRRLGGSVGRIIAQCGKSAARAIAALGLGYSSELGLGSFRRGGPCVSFATRLAESSCNF
jgi:hypothetical protein